MKERSDVWVVVPAYNEGPVIAATLEDLLALAFRIVVVDDGSEDDTWEQAGRKPVAIVRHVYNLGQGAALQTGIEYALEQVDTRFIMTFDADGQHLSTDLPRLLGALESGGYDVALGSRFLANGAALGIPATRRLALRIGVALTRWTTGMAVTDTHNGLRAFTADAAARLVIRQNGMAHASEILKQLSTLRLRWCEVPVTVRYSAYSLGKGQRITESINILWDALTARLR